MVEYIVILWQALDSFRNTKGTTSRRGKNKALRVKISPPKCIGPLSRILFRRQYHGSIKMYYFLLKIRINGWYLEIKPTFTNTKVAIETVKQT